MMWRCGPKNEACYFWLLIYFRSSIGWLLIYFRSSIGVVTAIVQLHRTKIHLLQCVDPESSLFLPHDNPSRSLIKLSGFGKSLIEFWRCRYLHGLPLKIPPTVGLTSWTKSLAKNPSRTPRYKTCCREPTLWLYSWKFRTSTGSWRWKAERCP